MNASDVMTPDVISADPDATVLQAAKYMLQHHISGLPVINKAGRLVGILSEGDLMRRRETRTDHKRFPWYVEFLMGPGKMAQEYTHTHGNMVSEVMTTDVYTVNEDASLEEIVELMEHRRIKRVPVVRGNKVVGIVTRSNLVRAMVSLARTAPQGAKDDATIRKKLLEELKREKWALSSLINVVVRGGVVELWGTIVDERQREALKVVAENIPGVTEVKDHLAWVELNSGVVIEPSKKVVESTV